MFCHTAFKNLTGRRSVFFSPSTFSSELHVAFPLLLVTNFPTEPNGLTSTYISPFKFITALGNYGPGKWLSRDDLQKLSFSSLFFSFLFGLKMRSCVKMISYSIFIVAAQRFIRTPGSWFIQGDGSMVVVVGGSSSFFKY